MDNREIARALGRSDGATKVLIHRAIKQLQEEMGDADSSDDPQRRHLGRRAAARRRPAPDRAAGAALGRFEDTIAAVTQAAAEELSDWAEELSESELRALRDPRNWVRPVVAVGAGGSPPARWSCSSCAAAANSKSERG